MCRQEIKFVVCGGGGMRVRLSVARGQTAFEATPSTAIAHVKFSHQRNKPVIQPPFAPGYLWYCIPACLTQPWNLACTVKLPYLQANLPSYHFQIFTVGYMIEFHVSQETCNFLMIRTSSSPGSSGSSSHDKNSFTSTEPSPLISSAILEASWKISSCHGMYECNNSCLDLDPPTIQKWSNMSAFLVYSLLEFERHSNMSLVEGPLPLSWFQDPHIFHSVKLTSLPLQIQPSPRKIFVASLNLYFLKGASCWHIPTSVYSLHLQCPALLCGSRSNAK